MDEITLGPYKVGDQPWGILYNSYDRSTGKRRNLTGYEAAVVLRRPDATQDSYAARVSQATTGEILFEWPDNPFVQAGNWDMEFWVSNGQRRFCTATFSFRVRPATVPPEIVFSQ